MEWVEPPALTQELFACMEIQLADGPWKHGCSYGRNGECPVHDTDFKVDHAPLPKPTEDILSASDYHSASNRGAEDGIAQLGSMVTGPIQGSGCSRNSGDHRILRRIALLSNDGLRLGAVSAQRLESYSVQKQAQIPGELHGMGELSV
jgi:hypothetical protein